MKSLLSSTLGLYCINCISTEWSVFSDMISSLITKPRALPQFHVEALSPASSYAGFHRVGIEVKLRRTYLLLLTTGIEIVAVLARALLQVSRIQGFV